MGHFAGGPPKPTRPAKLVAYLGFPLGCAAEEEEEEEEAKRQRKKKKDQARRVGQPKIGWGSPTPRTRRNGEKRLNRGQKTERRTASIAEPTSGAGAPARDRAEVPRACQSA